MSFLQIRRAAMAAALCAVAASAAAQLGEPEAWQEAEVAAPPQWNIDRLVEFPIEGQNALRYAIEPSTISIGPDGVVRYVFVARSGSGALNALFEGVRCETAQTKVYARWDSTARQWRNASPATWQPLDFRGPTRRAMQMARAGLCDNKVANQSPTQILNALRFGRADQSR